MLRRDRLILFVVAFFALGCLFDHLTTSYGLSSLTLCETNPMVMGLVERGIWHEMETLVIVVGVFYGLYSLKSMLGSSAHTSLRVLTFAGLIRFFAGFQNLSVILNVVS
jgi:hypothetical protein